VYAVFGGPTASLERASRTWCLYNHGMAGPGAYWYGAAWGVSRAAGSERASRAWYLLIRVSPIWYLAWYLAWYLTWY
jgi:hypothetical protein